MDANAESEFESECTCVIGYFDSDAGDAVNCVQCDPACYSCYGPGTTD